MRVHQWIEDNQGNYVAESDKYTHWYTCSICGYELVYNHHFEYEKIDDAQHKATCVTSGTDEGCGYSFTEDHTFTNPVLVRPTENADGTWTEGTYTSTCNCGEKETTTIDRANYEAYDNAKSALEKLLEDKTITAEAKAIIKEALKANDIAENYVATAKEQKIVDDAAAALKVTLDAINAGIADGSIIYVDLSAYNAALEIYNTKTASVAKDADKETAQTAIDSVAGITETSTKANGNQDTIDAATATLEALNKKYENCAAGNHSWGEPSLTIAPTKDNNGYYTYTCEICNETKIVEVSREDYTDYDEAIADANDLLDNEELTDAAKAEIREAIEEAEKLEENLPADVIVDGETIIDNNSDVKIKEATDKLNDVLNKIKNDETGAYEKPNYTEWNAAERTYDDLDKTNIKEEILNEVTELKNTINDLKADPKATAAEDQDTIDDATARLNEIIAGITDGSLRDPDYSKVEEKLEDANEAENLNKDTQDKIDAIEKALEEIKGKTEPEANAKDDQPAVDELERQLDEILDDIADGTATAPDYTEWDTAEDTYDEFTEEQLKDVKDEILDEVETLKNKINDLKDDPTANATEDQKTIDDATARLNEIIAGINDGSLRDPDYSKVEEKLEDANEAENLNKDTQDKIDAIEKALEEIKGKTEPEANAKDDQPAVDELERQLDEILDDIADGTATAPDYTEWDTAEDTYDEFTEEQLKDVKDEILDEVETLKNKINDLKDDPTANATEDQKTIDEATARLNAIIAGINDGSLKNPADFTEVNKDLADAKDKADKNDVVDGVKEDIQRIENKLNELKGDPTTNADDQPEIDALEKELEDIIKGINDGSLVKPDFDGYDASHDTYEELVKQYGDKIKDGVAKDVADLDIIVDGIREDETATKADDQDEVDNAKAALDAIIAGINDGSLRDPDYKDVEDKLAEVNNAEDLNKDTQDKIDAIEKELQEIKDKKDPKANAKDDQPKVDALEDRLDQIIKDIKDGKATAPDYTAWDTAEGAYDALDKKNVKDEILTEVTVLKNTINTLKADPTANATEDQETIDNATARLLAIIAGINDGSLKKPAVFTEVDKDLAEAKNKAENNDVVDGVKEDIQRIENKLNELKGDPTTNADDQPEIDALEKELEDIIKGINDGTLLNPDDGECKHTSTEYVVDNSNGDKLSTHSVKCKACGEILSTEACTFTTNTVDSTCRAEGYTTYCCTVCGYGFMADFTEMTAHNYGDWATEKGSCVKVMTKTRYCLNKDCYAQETVEVYENGKPVYGTHTLVIVNGQAATCLKDGHTDYTRCIVCNEVTESEVIPAIGHVDSNNNGNCDVCSGLMNPIGHCSCMCHGDTFFEKLLFRLVNFFWKLFKINANCECGAKHW